MLFLFHLLLLLVPRTYESGIPRRRARAARRESGHSISIKIKVVEHLEPRRSLPSRHRRFQIHRSIKCSVERMRGRMGRSTRCRGTRTRDTKSVKVTWTARLCIKGDLSAMRTRSPSSVSCYFLLCEEIGRREGTGGVVERGVGVERWLLLARQRTSRLHPTSRKCKVEITRARRVGHRGRGLIRWEERTTITSRSVMIDPCSIEYIHEALILCFRLACFISCITKGILQSPNSILETCN